MKKFYPLFIFIVILMSSCSKDFLERYENRIEGTWRVTNINRLGFGGGPGNLPFQDGTFTFNSNGTLVYRDEGNNIYQGTWEITRLRQDGKKTKALKLRAINFSNQVVLSEYYDDMNFRGTNFFVARIDRPLVRLTTHFRR